MAANNFPGPIDDTASIRNGVSVMVKATATSKKSSGVYAGLALSAQQVASHCTRLALEQGDFGAWGVRHQGLCAILGHGVTEEGKYLRVLRRLRKVPPYLAP